MRRKPTISINNPFSCMPDETLMQVRAIHLETQKKIDTGTAYNFNGFTFRAYQNDKEIVEFEMQRRGLKDA